VCPLSDAEQELWLDRAARQGWSRNELRRQIRAAGERAGASADAAARLVMLLDCERERRWREAAKRSDCELEDWVVRAVDEAATRALSARPGRAPASGPGLPPAGETAA
jgi:hypothetical protein